MPRQSANGIAYLVAEALLHRDYPEADPARIHSAAQGAARDLELMPDVSLVLVRGAGRATQLALSARAGRPIGQLAAGPRRDLVAALTRVAAPGIGDYLRAVGSLALLNFHDQQPVRVDA
jgi:hypothetical protein